jgi:Flp pilus assembly pilin Flp
MLKLYTWIVDLIRSERGQDMVEYALITVLISVAIVIAVLATGIIDAFETWATGVADCISSPDSTTCFP